MSVLPGVLLALSVAAPDAGFHVVRRDRTVEVQAQSIDELAQVLDTLRDDRGWHGLTALSFEQRVELAPIPGGCAFQGLKTMLEIVVTLPVLAAPEASTSPALARVWRRTAEGLRRHEEGHVALGIAEARASHERLASSGMYADCRAARRALLREELRLKQRQTFVHDRYDRVTRSGATQGAAVSLGVGRRPRRSD